MLLSELVDAWETVRGTSRRGEKVDALAEVLARTAPEEPDEVETVTSYLAGTLRQRRTGLGWRSLAALPQPAERASLTVTDVHRRFEEIAGVSGSGSRQRRADLVEDLFGRATGPEQRYLSGLVTGELRQGALDALVLEAVARAAGLPAETVRRAAMFCGSALPVATAALTDGAAGLARYLLQPGRPVRPMLASSAPDVPAALAKAAPDGGVVAVDRKLDGIRIQVHRYDGQVRVFTRSLEEITDRVPEVVEAVAALPEPTVVLDGEAIALRPDGRPRPFQETGARTATRGDVAALRREVPLTSYFFDLLRVGDDDLVDLPGSVRFERMRQVLPPELLVARVTTGDPAQAQAFFDDAVAAGHEGVVVKTLDAPYAAGRRGAAWVKVKPRHTLDLVVLAVEWGSGRRQGWLSNIHLGARDPRTGGWTMLGKTLQDSDRIGWVPVGKTFKGMTDEMLAWQTERFLELETHREGNVVHVRPEQVVEIAFDGVQRSTRYSEGGVALRFARVIRYRDDKTVAEADTIATIRAHLPSQ